MSSLSLTAYKALARTQKQARREPYQNRPDGPLIWGVVTHPTSARALVYLAERLRSLSGPCTLLLSSPDDRQTPDLSGNVLHCQLPADSTEECRRFLDHWSPAACLWIGGDLRPALVSETNARGIPMSLLAAQEASLDQPIWRWLPSLAREVLAPFERITAFDDSAERLLRKMDGARREIEVSGPLQVASLPPGVNESVFEDVSGDLNGRSVWLAAHVQKGELSDVLKAHREAIKITHRLALVLVAESFPVSVDARAMLKAQGWRVCHWEDGEPIEENTQIILVEEPEEMGLWYRIAPVSFLGSSLRHGARGIDPYLAAALGSAIIYGPNVGGHLDGYSRLAEAGAARIVKDDKSLGRAVSHLLAADQAAQMAHSAWEVISQGAEVTDMVIEDIQQWLDRVDAAQ